jgi:DAPG hydrolase PhiG domain
MKRWFEIEEPHDLAAWEAPLRKAPQAMATALAKGVTFTAEPFVPFAQMAEPEMRHVEDGIWRHPDGSLTVACTTEMPGVNASMWDWWFGWHSLSSARYRLWHPLAHQRSQLAEDRRHLPPGRARYINNLSAVDEFIGSQMTRLAIGFVEPKTFGLDQDFVDKLGTAICATVALRIQKIEHGKLVHMVENTPEGCIMRSRFHLGQFRSRLRIVGPILTLVINRPRLRRRLISDEIGLALLRHCFEEMHHLAALLPSLHARFHKD